MFLICILCVRVTINKRSFEPFCVWVLFQSAKRCHPNLDLSLSIYVMLFIRIHSAISAVSKQQGALDSFTDNHLRHLQPEPIWSSHSQALAKERTKELRVRACFSAAPGPCNRLPVPRRECNSRKTFQEEPRPTSSQTIRSGETVEKATRSLWSPSTRRGDCYVLDFAPPRDVSGDTLRAGSTTGK